MNAQIIQEISVRRDSIALTLLEPTRVLVHASKTNCPTREQVSVKVSVVGTAGTVGVLHVPC
jgi:hypothetical protein